MVVRARDVAYAAAIWLDGEKAGWMVTGTSRFSFAAGGVGYRFT